MKNLVDCRGRFVSITFLYGHRSQLILGTFHSKDNILSIIFDKYKYQLMSALLNVFEDLYNLSCLRFFVISCYTNIRIKKTGITV